MIDYEAAAGTAPSTSNLPYLEADHEHKLLVLDSKNFFGRNGNKYIVKVKVLATKATGKIESPAIGAERVVIINLDPPKKPGDPDYGMQNLMNYAYACNGGEITGATPAEKGGKLKRLLGTRAIDPVEAQRRGIAPIAFAEAMAIGMVVGDKTVAGMTKGDSNKPAHAITYHNWFSIKQDPAKVLPRKDAIKNNLPVDLSDVTL